MMTLDQRAKQFMPFDAMKGLQEALRDREERHSRVEKRILSEEQIEDNAFVLSQIEKGMVISMEYYKAFHYVHREGRVSNFSPEGHYLIIEDEKIRFEDIYSISIPDYSSEY